MKNINIENETISKLYAYFNDKNNKDFLINIFGKEKYEFTLGNFKENKEDNNNVTEKHEIIKANELGKSNIKQYYNNIENQDSNLSSLSSKFMAMDFKNITHNYSSEAKTLCNNEEKLANHILKKSEVILNTKKEEEKLVFIFESVRYGDSHILTSYERLLIIKEYFIKNKIKSIISRSFIKYLEFLEEFKVRINKEFKLRYKLKIDLEFLVFDKYDNDSIFYINCFYKFNSPSNLDIDSFIEENILVNKTNSKAQGFIYLINEINNEKYEGIKYQEISKKENTKASGNSNNNNPNNRDNPNISKSSNETKPQDFFYSSISKEETPFDLKKEVQKYQILKIIGIMGKHKDSAEFIIELSNGYYISGGADNILKIYDKYFNLKKELKIEVSTYSSFEREKLPNQNDYAIEIIEYYNKLLYKISLSFIDKEDIKYECQRFNFPHFTQINENNFAIILRNSEYSIDLSNSENSKIKNSLTSSEKFYLGSIKIAQNIIAITSNKVLYKGEDKLILYNINKKKISREIKGYSFNIGANGLALIPREEVKCNHKILLCACTKYMDDQKNGIYLVNPQFEDKKGINNTFYDTGNFEVFCFCPILIINPNNDILEKGKEIDIQDTEYFFVGGFNLDKKEGEIKLFKVVYNENESINKIEFVQVIEFERNKDFAGFEGAVNCIIKTKREKNGYILVTCYNGKVYLLTKPNLDYYLKNKNN